MSAPERIEVPDVILEQYRPRRAAARGAQTAWVTCCARARRFSAVSRRSTDRTPRSRGSIPPAWMARARPRAARAAPRSANGGRPGSSLADCARHSSLAAIALVIVLPRLAARCRPARAGGRDRFRSHQGLEPSLTVYRRTDRGSETLADGAVARTGDLLRLGYTAAGRRYGVILSIDGRGAVTLHLPSSGRACGAARPRRHSAARPGLRARRRARLGAVLSS